MVDALEDSLPDAPMPETSQAARGAAETANWQPTFTLEQAVAKLGSEIGDTLAKELNGVFREVRRYRPSASREAESRQVAPTASEDEAVPLEEEVDADAE